ncbi:disease resistance protein RPS2-like protein [Corchorus olitorius]|uniref:Disease resistance protein RPS2-like protein n=1 Tax=Corchorus olitorius TaxID=93759 RepID=A0A1R3K275_9ROSI|nr:disease resistance protein RPS2-like protein [Corchorus olitorius]
MALYIRRRNAIQRSCSYVFHYKLYVKLLEDGLKRLCDVRTALQREVDAAKTQRKMISPDGSRK